MEENKDKKESLKILGLFVLLFISVIIINITFSGDEFGCSNDTGNVNLDTIINGIVVQKPKENCRVFFTGLLVGDSARPMHESVAFKIDSCSEYVGQGNYPQNSEAFPKAVNSTFDGIAIGNDTRVIIYEQEDFKGEILFDQVGPAIIINSIWKNTQYDDDIDRILNGNLKGDLNDIFPNDRRFLSESNMHDWSYGSLRILCSDHEDYDKKFEAENDLSNTSSNNDAFLFPSQIYGNDEIDEFENSDLYISDGELGNYEDWVWYQDNCDGIEIGRGTFVTVSPISTTTYFLRAEKGTDKSDCMSFTVNVNSEETDAEKSVRSFLEALDNGNFDVAFYLQRIPRLGNLQEFSSTERYGGISKLIIDQINEIFNDGVNASVSATYKAFDPFNKDQDIGQVFTLLKTNNGWIITELETVNIYDI